MPVWPKSFYTFGLSLKTAATEWKLGRRRASRQAQGATLAQLTRQLAATSHWRGVGVTPEMPYEKFQTGIPLQHYPLLAPAIERMKRGERDVLWPGTCSLFVQTSGTATGEPRQLPMTEEMLAHFRRAGLDALMYYTVRVRHAGVFRGRHLLYGASTALHPLAATGAPEAFVGELSGLAALNLPGWAEKHLYEPGPGIGQMADYAAKVDAITNRIRPRDITMIAGLPNWTNLLAHALREAYSTGKHRIVHLQAHWPNLECFVHGGEAIGPYADDLRRSLGPAVTFHEIYAASEGFFAAQDGESAQGLRVMADMGIFFEFLPMTDFDEAHLDQLGPKAVPLPGVKTGVDYALLVTTPGGLVRYVLGDVVRFTSTLPPRLLVVGRTDARLNAFHERVVEREISDALVATCSRRGWTVVNFHVAPVVAPGNLTGLQRGHHEWWVELRPGTVATPTGPQMAADLDAELQRLNETYLARRKGGTLEAPVVRLVMPGVFEHWLRFHRKWGGQYKVPRCRNDRQVASQLAQVTNFALE